MGKDYPIKDCYDCAHNESCKYIASFKRTKLPIDKDTVMCTEHTPEQIIYDNIGKLVDNIRDEFQSVSEYEETLREDIKGKSRQEIELMFVERITEAIEDTRSLGFPEPVILELNIETAELLEIKEGDHISANGWSLDVHIVNDVTFGLFYLVYEGEDDDEL